jgi:hypothetical protein
MIMNITYGISIGKILLKGCKYDYSADFRGLRKSDVSICPDLCIEENVSGCPDKGRHYGL